MNTLEMAWRLHTTGFHPVSISRQTKLPTKGGWHVRPFVEDDYTNAVNVGVRLGEGGLCWSGRFEGLAPIDVDIDSNDALDIANEVLQPFPTWSWGRAGRPWSHHLYVVDLHDLPTKNGFRILDQNNKLIIELRGGRFDDQGGKHSAQSVCFGVHTSGEEITTYSKGIQRVKYEDIRSCVGTIARRVLARRGVDPLVIDGLALKWWRLDRPTTTPEPMAFGPVDDAIRAHLMEHVIPKLPISIQGSNGSRCLYGAMRGLVGDWALSPGQAIEVLTGWNAQCQPPWSRAELLRCAETALKEGQSGSKRKDWEERRREWLARGEARSARERAEVERILAMGEGRP